VLSYLSKKMSKDELAMKSGMNYTNLLSSMNALISAGIIEEKIEAGVVTYSKTANGEIKTLTLSPLSFPSTATS